MHKKKSKQHYILILLLTALLCFWSSEATAQDPEPDPPETEGTNQQEFIDELIETTDLTQDQVTLMLNEGLGWGEIVIATRLAEVIAADSGVTFNEALDSVLTSYADGMDFGEIAQEHDLKLGRVIGRGNVSGAGNSSPPFISRLIDTTDLTPEQVEQMRSGGAGWGNIMIATRLAERIAADSENPMTFEDALTSVLEARALDKGFGQIAHENDLKLGRLVKNSNKESAAFSYGPGEAGDAPNLNQNQNQNLNQGLNQNREIERERIQNQEKKQNIFGRFMNMIGFGRKERPEKGPKPERLERPQRPEKPDKPERPEKPAKPEKLERPERPARPEKPEKPEKPERGPRR